MPIDNNGKGGNDDDLLKTFVGILKSDDVVSLTEQVYKFVRRGRNAALTFFPNDRVEKKYNLDVLEDSDAVIRLVEKGPEEPPFRKIEVNDEDIIELNLTILGEKELQKVIDKIEPTFEEQGRLLTHEQELGYNVAENAKNDPKIAEILSIFDFLESRDKQLLRRGLSIRKAWEDDSTYIPRDQMEDWKDDLERKFGEHGSTVANFCSSGYFDPDNIMQKIMGEIRQEYTETGKVRSLYHNVLENEPFVVYVGKYDNPWPTSMEVREKLNQYDSFPYEIPYVDLRAQGYRNMRVAEQAIEHLREEIPDTAIQTQHSDKEFVFRINPEMVDELTE